MPLVAALADQLLCRHPERAASVLERHGPAAVTARLRRLEPAAAAEVLRRLSPQRATAVLAALPHDEAAALLAALPLEAAARLLRRLDAPDRAARLEALEPRLARSLRGLLRFEAHSAGALMDPEVLALPLDLSAGEALARVREQPEQARYNLYVVDGEQRLVGALNLRELLLAKAEERLAELMVPDPLRLPASADRTRVVAHPGWRQVHALPVVDEENHYLGAVRYHTLRELEAELLRRESADGDTARALGELFATGAAGLLDALAPAGGAPRER
jgi:magnesium transporter